MTENKIIQHINNSDLEKEFHGLSKPERREVLDEVKDDFNLEKTRKVLEEKRTKQRMLFLL